MSKPFDLPAARPRGNAPLYAGPATYLPGQTLFRLDHYLGIVLPAILVLVYLNLPIYLQLKSPGLLPKFHYMAFFVLLSPLLFLRPNAFISWLLKPFSIWATVLIVLNLVHYTSAMVDGDVNRAAVILTRIQYLALAVLVGFGFYIGKTSLYERAWVLLAILAPCMVIADFLSPGLFYPPGTQWTVPGRGSGPFINPTIAGEVILLTFLLACPVLKPVRRTQLLLLSGIGVVLTFSRAPIVAWTVLWLYLWYRRELGRPLLVLAVATGGVLMAGSFEAWLNSRYDLSAAINDIQTRLDFFFQPNLKDASAQDRMTVLQVGMDMFLQNPVIGEGAAVTAMGAVPPWPYEIGPHNQFVVLGAEYGIPGVALWFFIAWALWSGRYFREKALQRSVFFMFVFMTMFTHNMFEFPYWLITYALVSGQRRE